MANQTTSTLTEREITSLKEALLKRYQQQRQDMVITNGDGAEPRFHHHMADNGSDTHDLELKSYFSTREAKFETKIEQALERIKNGTYGICLSCGNQIPFDRLEACPTTTKCITCKKMGR